MKINILFTTNELPLAKIIRYLTSEDCSHCAVEFPELGLVIHATPPQVHIVRNVDFRSGVKVVHEISNLEITEIQFSKLLREVGSLYDIPALLYSGFRFALLKLGINPPKANLLQISGMYLCTEFVSKLLVGVELSTITPYKLYLLLKSR